MRALWVSVSLAAACGGSLGVNPPDAGIDAAGPPSVSSPKASTHDAAPEAESGRPDAGPPPDADSPPPVSLYGTWVGYLESFSAFPDGSDTARMTLSPAADGGIAATVLFGDAPPLTPTNPDLGPVPGLEGYGYYDASVLGLGEGILFVPRPISFASGALSMGMSLDDLAVQWCALQTHIYGTQPDGGGPPYACVPNWVETVDLEHGCSQTNPATDASVPVDCQKFGWCVIQGAQGDNVCECSATECHASTYSLQPDITLDLELSDRRLDGTIMGAMGMHNVHLRKSTP